jgi:hypothetical protein
MGHEESVNLCGPVDTSGSKNALQQQKSARTYLRKETAEGILGIASSDPESDDDGNGAEGITPISDKELSQVVDMVNETGADLDKFLEYLQVPQLEAIPKSKFKVAMSALQVKMKQKEKSV